MNVIAGYVQRIVNRSFMTHFSVCNACVCVFSCVCVFCLFFLFVYFFYIFRVFLFFLFIYFFICMLYSLLEVLLSCVPLVTVARYSNNFCLVLHVRYICCMNLYVL